MLSRKLILVVLIALTCSQGALARGRHRLRRSTAHAPYVDTNDLAYDETAHAPYVDQGPQYVDGWVNPQEQAPQQSVQPAWRKTSRRIRRRSASAVALKSPMPSAVPSAPESPKNDSISRTTMSSASETSRSAQSRVVRTNSSPVAPLQPRVPPSSCDDTRVIPMLFTDSPRVDLKLDPSSFRLFDLFYNLQVSQAKSEGFHRLENSWGSSEYRPLKILVRSDSIGSWFVVEFLETLSQEKAKLMKLYDLSDAEYNRLAVMAFGIMGAETKYGQSQKYMIKESMQFAVDAGKIWRAAKIETQSKSAKGEIPHYPGAKFIDQIGNDVEFSKMAMNQPGLFGINSRGPTQIKYIPDAIQKNYQISHELLKDPRYAAVATLGTLAEDLNRVRVQAERRSLDFVTDTNVYDFIPFLYTGRSKKLLKGTANQWALVYDQSIKKSMKLLEVYEK